jgi:hypothetical protein
MQEYTMAAIFMFQPLKATLQPQGAHLDIDSVIYWCMVTAHAFLDA